MGKISDFPKSHSIRSKLNEYDKYHRKQNKFYPEVCSLAHFEAYLDFTRNEFTCP